MSQPSNAGTSAAPPPEQGTDALPVGARLAEFEIREVLGAGGFGVVYRAWDEALQRDVALKEYMPVSLAGRGAGERVTLRSRTNEEDFALGLQSFVNEARLLARFDQPALVKVFRFWEANGTAYMAMPLYRGRNLRQLRRELAPRTLDDAWIRALVEPLLGALEVMHDAAVYHRDIAPDNILWCDNDRPVLLDFGAARVVLGDRTQNVTAILKPQFAPIEQYAETQSMRQGPWTDLYALAGTCYFMLTGRAPIPATARVMSDELEPLARLAPPGCSPRLLEILDWAMAVRPQDRPQSVAEFRDALAGRIDGPVPVRAVRQALAPSVAAASDASGYEKTIQATLHTAATGRAAASQAAAAASSTAVARGHPDSDFGSPERTVMLPPKSGLPLKSVMLLLIVAAAAAGAWTTRLQWMPAVGLQGALRPAAGPAASPDASASAAESTPMTAPASGPASDPASAPGSQTSAVARADAASAASSAASADAAVAPASVAEAPPTHAASSKASTRSRDKALAARIAALTLPPPVLPPANESHLVAPAHAVANAASEAVETSAAAVAASAAPRDVGPREVCADQGAGKMAACVKRLCDTYPRYQRYPVCQRMQRREDPQRGTSE